MILPPAHESIRLSITHATAVGDARRVTAGLTQALAWNETEAGKAALIVTECGTNLVQHAREGELLLRTLRSPEGNGLEVLALDKGPGMRDVARCLQDGYSSRGTAGAGLGGIRRMSTIFDLHSIEGRGTTVLAQLWSRGAESAALQRMQVGAICVAKTGEEVCGDAWAAKITPARSVLMVCDGLGHGQGAADASRAALDVFGTQTHARPSDILQSLHLALRSTRGASVCVVELERDTLRFASVGNCAGTVLGAGQSHGLTPHNGTVGSQMMRLQEFSYPWPEDGLLILHSDGLSARWRLDDYAGLALRHPALIAGVLYRDFQRGRDDSTVVVARRAERDSSRFRGGSPA